MTWGALIRKNCVNMKSFFFLHFPRFSPQNSVSTDRSDGGLCPKFENSGGKSTRRTYSKIINFGWGERGSMQMSGSRVTPGGAEIATFSQFLDNLIFPNILSVGFLSWRPHRRTRKKTVTSPPPHLPDNTQTTPRQLPDKLHVRHAPCWASAHDGRF